MAKLTTRTLETMKPGPKAKEHPDGLVSGLYYCLQPSGRGSWTVRYRIKGRSRKVTLGSFPAIGLATARELAKTSLGQIAQGRDVAAEKKAARARPPDHDLVETVVEQFIARRVEPLRSAREIKRILRKEIKASFRGRGLGELTARDINMLRDRIADRGSPAMAERVVVIFKTLCSWAVERELLEVSPAAGIRTRAPRHSRDRILDDLELLTVWRAADKLGWPFGPIVCLLALTGQRRGEVAGLRWFEIDLESGVWELPKERVKNGRAHVVPLAPAAVELLRCLPCIANEHDLVFPAAKGGGRLTGFSTAKARLDALLPLGFAPWCLHDLRRSFASGCARLGIGMHVVEKLLNHVSGSFGGIAGVYQKHSFSDEKRAAAEAWARHVGRIVSGQAVDENVIRLAGARQ
jgi:integrase